MLGAAVSGQNYTAPGWKKVIVALMGPLPGIIVAGVIGGAALDLRKPIYTEAAFLALVLNGLNLLPVLPLDGGRVMHTLFFSRHHLLDVGFRLAAAGVLILGGVYLSDRVLIFLGIFMLLSVPAAYKIARIATDLRRSGLGTRIREGAVVHVDETTPPPPQLPDLNYANTTLEDQFIPTDVAQAIITKVKGSFKRALPVKVIAQHTLSIYESLATRPPGWAATLGLSVLHGFSFLLACGLIVTLLVAPMGGLRALRGFRASRAAMVIPTPKHVLLTADIDSRKGVAQQVGGRPPICTVIGTFRDRQVSRSAYDEAKLQKPPSASTTLFGNSVLISLYDGGDAARNEWVAWMKARSAEAVVDQPDKPVAISIQCKTPSAQRAEALQAELAEYMDVPFRAHLIPPWRMEQFSAAERDQFRRARKTYVQLHQASFKAMSSKEVSQKTNEFIEAASKGDKETMKRLENERTQLIDEQRRRAVVEVRLRPESDPQVVSAYEAELAALSMDGLPAIHLLLGKPMGQLELIDDQPASSAERYTVRGTAENQGAVLNLRWLTCPDLAEGLPALIAWLESQGCTEFRYDSRGEANEDPIEDVN